MYLNILCISHYFMYSRKCILCAWCSSACLNKKIKEKIVPVFKVLQQYLNHPAFTSTATDEDHEAANWNLNRNLLGANWQSKYQHCVTILQSGAQTNNRFHCKEILREFEYFHIYKGLYGKPLKRDWVVRVVFLTQTFLAFGGRCESYFWDIPLKFTDYLIWICSFSSCEQNFSKANFSFMTKLTKALAY